MTARRYLKSLERGHLTAEQWEQLSDRAVLRLARFPSIAEPHDIACEVQHQAQNKANSEWLAKVRAEWSHHQPEEKGDSSPLLGSQALP